MGQSHGPRREAAGDARARRRLRVRADGVRRLVSEPADAGNIVFGSRPRRRRQHRRRPAGGRHSLRRQFGRRLGADAGRSDPAGSHDPGAEGPAAQRQRRRRALRQARLPRPHLVHAAGHARAGAGRRARPHHSDDSRRQGGARPCGARRRRLVPPRAPAALGLGHHPRRRLRSALDGACDSQARRGGGPGHEAGGGDGARRQRAVARLGLAIARQRARQSADAANERVARDPRIRSHARSRLI